MAGISDEDIRRVREASDLASIAAERMQLRQKGRDLWGCCPFHGEKTPSFKIDPNSQLWHCFGCGEGGDVFSFVMKRDEIGFLDAVRELAKRANIQLTEDRSTMISRGKKGRLKEVCEATANFYHTQLMRGKGSQVQAAREYLGKRQLGSQVSKDWTLGFAPGRGSLVAHLRSLGFTPQEMVEANVALAPLQSPQASGGQGASISASTQVKDRFYDRIMFPIRDIDGDVIAFGGRVVGKGEPKYLNSQETPIFHKSEVLYGIEKAKAAMASSGVAIIVEGYTDVIALHEAGLKNVVATLGTALTKQHVRALSRHAKRRIVYLFDGDEAGQRAADRAARFLDESMLPEAGRSQIQLCAVTLPDNLDPADYVSSYGADALRGLIDQAVPLLRYALDRKLSQYDPKDFSQKGVALKGCLELLAPIKESILAQEYAGYLADRLLMDQDVVRERLAKMPVNRGAALTDEPRSQSAQGSLVSMAYASDSNASRPSDSYGHYGANGGSGQYLSGLSAQDRHRLSIEREFLCLCVRDPQIAISQASALVSTNWHDKTYEACAQALLDALEANLSIDSASLLTAVATRVPAASSILTSSRISDDVSCADLVNFLLEEIAIGDLDEAIFALNAQLKRGDGVIPEEQYDEMYKQVVDLQAQVRTLRQGHTAVDFAFE